MDKFYMFIGATQSVESKSIVICEVFVAKST